jgi:ATP-dependent protease ClpP protease subunit
MATFLTHNKKTAAKALAGDIQPSANWFSIRNQSKASADVYIYDEISWFGIVATDIAKQINGLDVDTINLHINSPGGLVFDGVAIFNLFKQHKSKVIVHIDGLAASIASVIAMAGDEVHIADNAMVMVHNPLVMMIGNAAELRKEADVLDQIKETLITTYQNHSELERDEIALMMDEETWMDADAAIHNGFATHKIEARKEAASAVSGFDFTNFANAPEGWELRHKQEAKAPSEPCKARAERMAKL